MVSKSDIEFLALKLMSLFMTAVWAFCVFYLFIQAECIFRLSLPIAVTLKPINSAIQTFCLRWLANQTNKDPTYASWFLQMGEYIELVRLSGFYPCMIHGKDFV